MTDFLEIWKQLTRRDRGDDDKGSTGSSSRYHTSSSLSFKTPYKSNPFASGSRGSPFLIDYYYSETMSNHSCKAIAGRTTADFS